MLSVKAVLIDLSGTLHVEQNAIPGAVDALDRLRKCGVSVRFVTNTTKESKEILFNRLTGCGFKLNKEEIFSSLSAACHYVKKKQLNPILLLDSAALSDFDGIADNVSNKSINAIVVGLSASNFNYDHLNEAFRHIMGGAELIAIHKGRYWSRGDGLALGPGPFVTALEYATSKLATVVGKPEKSFFLSTTEGLNCESHHVVMIGDDVRDDVQGAMLAGYNAILVRTGKYLPGDEHKISPPPTQVCDNFSDAVDFIIQNL